jgi:hypothetical protein
MVGCGAVSGVVVVIVGPVGRQAWHLWYDAARQEASGGSQRVDLIVKVKGSVQQWEAEGDEKEKPTINRYDPRGIEFLREKPIQSFVEEGRD